MKNVINWFEIPSEDFERAVKFYNSILDIELNLTNVNGILMGMWPFEDVYNAGAVVKDIKHTPGGDGVRIYLNAAGNMDAILERVEQNGGKIVEPKTFINPENGYFSLIQDSEGNVIGLHSEE